MSPRTTLLLLPFALLPACSRYAAPQLALSNAAVTEQSPDGTVLAFTFDARNTNEVELPLHEVRYTLSLDGREVFRGVRSPEATLRRLGTQRITIPAVIPSAAHAATGVVPYTLQGDLTYSTPGQIERVLFDINIRRPDVAFRHEGTIDLGQTPTAPAPATTSPAH